MIQGNGKISNALGLEELTLLKWPYYPKQSTDSMRSLSNYSCFHRTRTNNPKIYMEPWKTQYCQRNPEENEQSRRHNPLRLQTILQSYSDENSVVLAQKQTYGSMEQNREPRKKPTQLQSINLWQRRQEYKMGKRQSLQQLLLGKLDSCM